jgi:hypothetical protein
MTLTALDRIRGTPSVDSLYQGLLDQPDTLGTYQVEPKKTPTPRCTARASARASRCPDVDATTRSC